MELGKLKSASAELNDTRSELSYPPCPFVAPFPFWCVVEAAVCRNENGPPSSIPVMPTEAPAGLSSRYAPELLVGVAPLAGG